MSLPSCYPRPAEATPIDLVQILLLISHVSILNTHIAILMSNVFIARAAMGLFLTFFSAKKVTKTERSELMDAIENKS